MFKKDIFNTIYSLIVILVIWYILSFIIDSAIIPVPSSVFTVFADDFFFEILPHLLMKRSKKALLWILW